MIEVVISVFVLVNTVLLSAVEEEVSEMLTICVVGISAVELCVSS